MRIVYEKDAHTKEYLWRAEARTRVGPSGLGWDHVGTGDTVTEALVHLIESMEENCV